MMKSLLRTLFLLSPVFLSASYSRAQECNAHFTYTMSTNGTFTIPFSPVLEEGVASYYWDFGDGSSSYASDPVHTYADPGTYEVCLEVTMTDGTTCATCINICIYEGTSTLSLDGIGFTEDNLNLYPNPDASYWNLEVDLNRRQDLDIQVTDAMGRIVYKYQINGQAGKNHMKIPVRDFPDGVYFINILNGHGSLSIKAVKN